ncbi:hypothetical protein Peur_005119 [Populus x canadensis]
MSSYCWHGRDDRATPKLAIPHKSINHITSACTWLNYKLFLTIHEIKSPIRETPSDPGSHGHELYPPLIN